MGLFDPWQETIKLLSGTKPRRTVRPGEQFEAVEMVLRSPKIRVGFLWCRICVWLGSTSNCTSG